MGLSSNDLKLEAMAWLRFQKQMPYVATECESMDVFGCDLKKSIEIETKISIADFKRDFYKDKHKLLAKYAPKIPGAGSTIPAFFYFMVPASLVEKAQTHLDSIIEQHPIVSSYGLLSIPDTWEPNGAAGKWVTIVRKPKRLHQEHPHPAMITTLCKRMSSELISMHFALDRVMNLRHSFDMDLRKFLDRNHSLIDGTDVE